MWGFLDDFVSLGTNSCFSKSGQSRVLETNLCASYDLPIIQANFLCYRAKTDGVVILLCGEK